MEGTRMTTGSRTPLNLKPLSGEQKRKGKEWGESKDGKTDMERLLQAQEYKGMQESLKARMDESIIDGFNTTIWSKTNESEKDFLIKCSESENLIVVDDRIELKGNSDIHMHLFIKNGSIFIQATSRCEDERPGGKCNDPGGGNVSGCHYQVDETLWKGRKGAPNPKSRFKRNLRLLLTSYMDDNIVVALIERKLLSYNDKCNMVCETTNCEGSSIGDIKKSKRKNKKRTKKKSKRKKTKQKGIKSKNNKKNKSKKNKNKKRIN